MKELGPTLQTARLVLRPPVQADLDAWASSMADEETQRYIGGVQPRAAAWLAAPCTRAKTMSPGAAKASPGKVARLVNVTRPAARRVSGKRIFTAVLDLAGLLDTARPPSRKPVF